MHSWLKQWFEDGAADVARRQRSDVDRMGVMEEAIDEAQSRGWHLVEVGAQVVLLRIPGTMTIIC